MPKQFTEGSWEVCLWELDNKNHVAVAGPTQPICLISEFKNLSFEDKMNANLIAHAPQMYDALDKLRDSSDEVRTLLDKIDDIPNVLNFEL